VYVRVESLAGGCPPASFPSGKHRGRSTRGSCCFLGWKWRGGSESSAHSNYGNLCGTGRCQDGRGNQAGGTDADRETPMATQDGQDRQLERCENCERIIGRLETPWVFDGHIVCRECHDVLARQSVGKDAASLPASQSAERVVAQVESVTDPMGRSPLTISRP
jgi:hypothetical protein